MKNNMKNNRLEQYLQDASQGLYGKQRKMVIQELRGNLEQHVKERMAFGTSENKALEEMLDAFGASQIVSRGMWGVHMKPVFSKVAAIVGLLSIGMVSVLTASAQSIHLLSENKSEMYWVGIDSLFQAIGWKDGKIEVKDVHFSISKAGKSLIKYEFANEKSAKSSIKYEGLEKYVMINDVIEALSNFRDTPIYFDSPINTHFKIGDKSLIFEKNDSKVNLNNSISMVMGEQLRSYVGHYLGSSNFSTTTINACKGYRHYIHGNAKPNHPYLALWSGWQKLNGEKNDRLYLRSNILQSDINGDFKFDTAYREVYFADKWETLKNMKNNQLLLVEMTGRLNPSQNGKYDDLIVPSSVLKIPISIGRKTQ